MCNKSKQSINLNDKSITPEYIGDSRKDPADQYYIEKIASPISKALSQGRGGDLSSVTEEAIDTFEQSENPNTSQKKPYLYEPYHPQAYYHQGIQEESEYEEEEEEEEEGSESEESGDTYQQSDRNYDYYGNKPRDARDESSSEEGYYDGYDDRFENWIRMLKLPMNQS